MGRILVTYSITDQIDQSRVRDFLHGSKKMEKEHHHHGFGKRKNSKLVKKLPPLLGFSIEGRARIEGNDGFGIWW
jgi:hypothetical protein